MLASVTSFQPQPQGFQNSRLASAINEKVHSNEKLENENGEKLKSESSKLTKKALSELSQKEQVKVQKLKTRDLEVRAHEQAHLSAAGSLSRGGASFTYTTGPNGVRYATGGEVSIDTSAVANNPAATIKKAETIRRAALAPANPSQQDQLIANKASTLKQNARIELSLEIQEANEETQETEKKPTEEDTKNNNKFSDNPTTFPGSLINITV